MTEPDRPPQTPRPSSPHPPGGAAAGVPGPSAGPPPNTGGPGLPASLTGFVGQEREVAAVRGLLLCPEGRPLALTGSGGMGKIRPALRVAEGVALRHVNGPFADGVRFVPLAALTNPAQVLTAVARA